MSRGLMQQVHKRPSEREERRREVPPDSMTLGIR